MREKSGLTLVEILTVLAIIALLAGILIPAITAVKDVAKEVKQKGQFVAIELALETWKNDENIPGIDYPESYYGHNDPTGLFPLVGGIYCGGQKLAEALMGQDLLGFHPKSLFRHDGLAPDMTAVPPALVPLYDPTTLSARRKPFLESGTQYAFTLNDLYPNSPSAGQPGTDRYVLCDVYGATRVTLFDGSIVKAGAPILYYKADPSGKFNDPSVMDSSDPSNNQGNIYNCYDNILIVNRQEAVKGAATPFDESAFYSYIRDPKVRTMSTPYNPNSYILISAGADGIYGTEDDIRNFGN